MSEKPIIFNAEMVRAILNNRKSMTRRVVDCPPDTTSVYWTEDDDTIPAGKYTGWVVECSAPLRLPRNCPYGRPGDRLYVKENWAQRKDLDHLNGTQLYEAGVREAWYWVDGPGKCCNTGCAGAAGRVRTAHLMPRWASRITLKITDIRVERVQDISEADAIAEGVEPITEYTSAWGPQQTPHWFSFMKLWDSLNAQRGYGWDVNPWVWVIEFKRLEP